MRRCHREAGRPTRRVRSIVKPRRPCRGERTGTSRFPRVARRAAWRPGAPPVARPCVPAGDDRARLGYAGLRRQFRWGRRWLALGGRWWGGRGRRRTHCLRNITSAGMFPGTAWSFRNCRNGGRRRAPGPSSGAGESWWPPLRRRAGKLMMGGRSRGMGDLLSGRQTCSPLAGNAVKRRGVEPAFVSPFQGSNCFWGPFTGGFHRRLLPRWPGRASGAAAGRAGGAAVGRSSSRRCSGGAKGKDVTVSTGGASGRGAAWRSTHAEPAFVSPFQGSNCFWGAFTGGFHRRLLPRWPGRASITHHFVIGWEVDTTTTCRW